MTERDEQYRGPLRALGPLPRREITVQLAAVSGGGQEKSNGDLPLLGSTWGGCWIVSACSHDGARWANSEAGAVLRQQWNVQTCTLGADGRGVEVGWLADGLSVAALLCRHSLAATQASTASFAIAAQYLHALAHLIIPALSRHAEACLQQRRQK